MAFNEKYVEFGGTDEYATAGDILGFERTDAFSFALWFKTTNTSSFLIAKQESAVPTGWGVGVGSSGQLFFEMIYDFGAGDRFRIDTDSIYSDGGWHHVVVTFSGNGSTSGVTFYVDGSAVAATSIIDALGNNIANSADLYLGSRESDHPTFAYVGGLDEVAVYDKELSLAEVQAIRGPGDVNSAPDLGSLSTAGNLLSWWRMGDGDTFPRLVNYVSGDEAGAVAVFPTILDESGLTPASDLTIPDESGNGYDGTMTNMEVTDIVYGGPLAYAPVNEPVQLVYTESALDDGNYWLFDSNESLGGEPSVTQFSSSQRTLGWTVVGTASETAIRAVYDGADIWIGGNDASGNAQVKRMTLGTPPTFGSGYSVSSNGIIDMVYGGGYLWVADTAGIWRVDPANLSGPHTAVTTEAGIIGLFYDADTTNYGDSQPRLYAITDGSGDRAIHRYELATPAEDDSITLGIGSGGGRAVCVGNGAVFACYYNGSSNVVGEWTPDPLSFTHSSVGIQGYMSGRPLDIQWDDYNSQVVVLGVYQTGDPRSAMIDIRSDGSLNPERGGYGTGGVVWSSGAHPRYTRIGNTVYVPSKEGDPAYRLGRQTLSYLTTPSYFGLSKFSSFSRKFLRFDGVNEYVDCGDVLGFDIDEPFSISLWVRMTTTIESEPLASKYSPVGWRFQIRTDGTLEMNMTDGGNSLIRRGTTNVGDGNWHHVVMTYDGSNNANNITFYVDNGVEGYTALNTPITTLLNSSSFLIGRPGPSTASYFDGDMDEVAVYDKELSAPEVEAIWNYGRPNDLSALSSATNLQGWWRMGDGLGVYNGTMTNMDAGDNVVDVPRTSFCKYSLEFPASQNEYYDHGNAHAFEYTDSFTVSLWVKTTTPSGRWMFAVFKMEGATTYRGWGFYVRGDTGAILFSLNNQDGSNQIQVQSTDAVNDGEWHHIMATWEGSATPAAADLTLYIDGAAQTPVVNADTLTGTIVNAEPLCIGNRAAALQSNVDGRLTEVSIWDRALDVNEVAWVYNLGLPRDLAAEESTASLAFVKTENMALSGGDMAHDIDRDSDWSFSIWFKTSNTTGQQGFFGKATDWSGYPHGWQFGIYPPGVIWIWMLYTWSPSNQLRTCTSSSWADGNWHHCVITHDSTIAGGGKKASCKVYVDGVEQALDGTAISQIDTLANNVDGAYEFRIGDCNVTFPTFDGNLDEAAIYDKVLSPAEVRWLAGNPSDLTAVGAPSDLRVWWKLGETLDGQRLVVEETDGVANYYSPLTTSIRLNEGVTDQVIDFDSVPEAVFAVGEPYTFGIWIKSPMPVYDPYPVAVRTDTLMCKHSTNSTYGGFAVGCDYRSVVPASPQLLLKAFIQRNGFWYSYSIGGGWANTYNRGKAWWDDTWRLIVITWDGSSTILGWVDGQRRTEGSPSSGAVYGGTPANDGKLIIGNSSAGGTAPADANVCHAFIYNKALNSTEIRQVYNEGVPPDLSVVGPTANLVFWSALGDGDALGTDNVLDLSGNANHGTFINGASEDFEAEAPSPKRSLVRGGKDSWWNPTPTAPVGEVPSVSTDVPLPLLTDLAGWWRCGTLDNPYFQVRDFAFPRTSGYSPLTTSISLGGVDEYVSFARFAAIDFDDSDPCTMGVWVKYTSGGDQVILAKEWVSGVSQGWLIRITDTDIYAAYQPKGLSGNVGYSRWGVSHNDGEWHLILFTWDGSTAPDIYVDGRTGTMGTGSSTSALFRAGTTGNLNFGRKNDGSYFTGQVVHGFIYDKELTQAEVTAIHGGGVPQDLTKVGPTANLVHWAPLGDGDALGTGNMQDISGGNNDGEYVNGDAEDFVLDAPAAPQESTTVRDVSRWDSHCAMTNMDAGNVSTDTPGGEAVYSLDFNAHINYVSYRYLEFNASGWVDMGDVLGFERDQPFSVSFWIRCQNPGPRYFATKQDGSTTYRGWRVYMDASEYLTFDLISDDATTNKISVQVQSALPINANFQYNYRWQHIVVTYDGSSTAAGIAIYRNGSPQTVVPLTDNLTATILTTAAFRLAAAQWTTSSRFYGDMDEVSVWNAALSAGDVTTLYNGGVPNDVSTSGVSGLVSWYRMGDGDTLPTITDNAGSNDGTVGGSGTRVSYAYPPGTEQANEQLYDSTQRHSHHFETSRSFMLSFWIKTTSEIGTVYLSGSTQYFYGYGCYLQDGYLHYAMSDTQDWYTSTTAGYTIRSANRVNDGAWHHIVVGQYTQRGAYIWVDGVQQTRVTLVNATTNSIGTSGYLMIGGSRFDTSTPADGLVGKLAEMSVWSGYLGQDHVDELYNSGSPPDLESLTHAKRLKGWWRMGASAGNPGAPVNVGLQDFRKRGDAPGTEAWSTRSLNFDGVNDYLNIGNRFGFEWTTPFSVSMWTKGHFEDRFDSSWVGMIKIGTGAEGWMLGNYYTMKFEIRSNVSGDGWIWMQIEDRKVISSQEWDHVCVTYDGSGDYRGVSMYVNGYPERMDQYAYNEFLPTVTAVAGTSLNMGRSGSSSYDAGNLDEVSFWQRELTEAEVLELFANGAPTDLTTHSAADNIEAWWRMGEGTADATMVNMEAEDIRNLILQIAAALQGDATVTATAGFLIELAASIEGDATITGDLLGQLEVAADLAGQATMTGATNVDRPVSAELAGMAEVIAVGLVRERVAHVPTPPEHTSPRLERSAGLQPGRETPPQEPRWRVSTGRNAGEDPIRGRTRNPRGE